MTAQEKYELVTVSYHRNLSMSDSFLSLQEDRDGGLPRLDTASCQHSQDNEHFVYIKFLRSFSLAMYRQNLPANITAVLHDMDLRPLEVSRFVN